MKARITHLKAPWPSGAVVGDVVEFAVGTVPVWAAGKCVQVGEDDEEPVSHVITPPEAPASLSVVIDSITMGNVAQMQIDQLKAEHAAETADLQAKLQALTGENESLSTALAESRSKLAELQATTPKKK